MAHSSGLPQVERAGGAKCTFGGVASLFGAEPGPLQAKGVLCGSRRLGWSWNQDWESAGGPQVLGIRYGHSSAGKYGGGEKESVSRYWSGQIGSSFPKDDALRIRLFALQLIFEKDPEAHSAKLASQLKSGEVTLSRVASFAKAIERDTKRQFAFASEYGGPLVGATKPQDWISLIAAIENSVKAAFFEKHLATQHSRLDRKGKTYFMNQLRRYGMHNEAAIVLRESVQPG